MKKEDKNLLFSYLCMALPYNVCIDYSYNAFKMHKGNYGSCIKQGTKCLLNCDYLDIFMSPRQNEEGEYIKPYLRSLSNMTEEEMDTYANTGSFLYANGIPYNLVYTTEGLLFLLNNHFDIFGLIPKGLAIAVTEDNNPYKIVEEQI